MSDRWTIEVHHGGRWHAAASVERFGERRTRHASTHFEYDIDYASARLGERGAQAVSVAYPVDLDIRTASTFPAFAVDLLPQGEAQRTLLARLREAGRDTSEWAQLGAGAGNPVGNLRVAEAVTPVEPAEGVPREDIVRRGDQFRAWAEAQGIPMTGASDTSGASPKLLLTQDRDGRYHADGALPDARAARHFLVKFPRGRTSADAQVLANEAPYLEVARALGLRCGEPLAHEDGALFMPRFDRRCVDGRVERRGLESLYSVLGVVEAGASLRFEAVCAAVAAVVDDPEGELVELVLRDAVAVALGDTDNHGRNTSLLERTDGGVELSPLYDFAPMYLDPDLIKRTTRWRSEAEGEPDWSDVCAALEPLVPREVLAPRMRALGERLEDVRARMRDAGVDASIVERREPSARAVAEALGRVEGG
ncbi:MAG: HipA domain-containing protein [Sandaracinaceae bacterium]|nr:HipA domain-containing protein [Sandaracinaceae bacterium]